jgi:hypothetical protein
MPVALRFWLKTAAYLCALALIVLGPVSLASAYEAPSQRLEFVKTPTPIPAPNFNIDPDLCTPDTEAAAHALAPVPSRSAPCDVATRLRLPLAEMMLDRSERPLLRPPITP